MMVFIQFKLLGQDKAVTQRITIFGIRLKKREKVKTKKKKNKSSEDDNNIEGNPENSQTVQEENRKDEVPHKEPVEDNSGCETCTEGTDREKVGIFTKIKNFFNSLISKIRQTFAKICDTIKTVKDKIHKVDEFLHDEKNIELFTLGKNELFYLLKHYMPRKWKGRLLLGTGDPASTGYALGTLYALYPVHGGNLIVTPDFENKIIKEFKDMLENKLNEINISQNWNPKTLDPEKMGGFNFGSEDKILRYIFRGDTIYDVIIPEDAEVIKVDDEKGIYRANKIIVTNPRKITDDFVMELYKKNTLSNKIIAQCLVTLLWKKRKEISKYII